MLHLCSRASLFALTVTLFHVHMLECLCQYSINKMYDGSKNTLPLVTFCQSVRIRKDVCFAGDEDDSVHTELETERDGSLAGNLRH